MRATQCLHDEGDTVPALHHSLQLGCYVSNAVWDCVQHSAVVVFVSPHDVLMLDSSLSLRAVVSTDLCLTCLTPCAVASGTTIAATCTRPSTGWPQGGFRVTVQATSVGADGCRSSNTSFTLVTPTSPAAPPSIQGPASNTLCTNAGRFSMNFTIRTIGNTSSIVTVPSPVAGVSCTASPVTGKGDKCCVKTKLMTAHICVAAHTHTRPPLHPQHVWLVGLRPAVV